MKANRKSQGPFSYARFIPLGLVVLIAVFFAGNQNDEKCLLALRVRPLYDSFLTRKHSANSRAPIYPNVFLNCSRVDA